MPVVGALRSLSLLTKIALEKKQNKKQPLIDKKEALTRTLLSAERTQPSVLSAALFLASCFVNPSPVREKQYNK